MKRASFTEEQIIGILRENEAGAKAGGLARKHGVSEGTIYAWKAEFGGMSVSEAQRRKMLEDENRRLNPGRQVKPPLSPRLHGPYEAFSLPTPTPRPELMWKRPEALCVGVESS